MCVCGGGGVWRGARAYAYLHTVYISCALIINLIINQSFSFSLFAHISISFLLSIIKSSEYETRPRVSYNSHFIGRRHAQSPM